MKSINPIQKYPHIIVSFACIVSINTCYKIFISNEFLTSFGIFTTVKLSKYITFLAFRYKAIQ